ncbi:MAG: hypothetical protein EXR99_00665 [Gemmataceae bacterium]|nr:hypothetical protein [Gemmataceae bacterium]
MKLFSLPICRMVLLAFVFLLPCNLLLFSQPSPKDSPELEKEIAHIGLKQKNLQSEIEALERLGIDDSLVVEAQVFSKALVWLLKTGDLQQKGIFKKAGEIAAIGSRRVSQLKTGKTPWRLETEKPIARAYRSSVDGSVQPYGITLPKGYGLEPGKNYPLHVVLHGRNDKLNEVTFLNDNGGTKSRPGQPFIELQVYGRGNNAYRWAGEADVKEALVNFLLQEHKQGRSSLPDRNRLVLRGFSMGGAGTWHLGLHQPDSWCVIGPGAGFTTTHGYAPNLPEKLPPHQEDCLTIYDAYRYAENASMVPVVAYSGALDKQKKAADLMEKTIRALGIPMEHLIAPGLEHKFPPEWLEKAQKLYSPHIQRGRDSYPSHIRFTTYTLKYSSCHWIQIRGLEQHYTQAKVEANYSNNSFDIKTSNVQSLAITLPPGKDSSNLTLQMNGMTPKGKAQSLEGKWMIQKEPKTGEWEWLSPDLIVNRKEKSPRKSPGLQGPIDDAFASSFLCVVGTGAPWNESIHQTAMNELASFRKDWELFFRGDLPVKTDREVTPEDIAFKNLVLFGDPGSNALIAQAMKGMPFTWGREKVGWHSGEFSSKDHYPVMAFPNPMSPSRYVVLNSGHTFKEADCRGTNALLYPRLGDFALMKVQPSQPPSPLSAGIFTEDWKFPQPPGIR